MKIITLSGGRWNVNGCSKETSRKEGPSKKTRRKEGSPQEEIIFGVSFYCFYLFFGISQKFSSIINSGMYFDFREISGNRERADVIHLHLIPDTRPSHSRPRGDFPDRWPDRRRHNLSRVSHGTPHECPFPGFKTENPAEFRIIRHLCRGRNDLEPEAESRCF